VTGTAQFILSEAHAGFCESGVRIVAASRDAGNRPLLGLAVGCRVCADRCRVTLFLPRHRYPLLIDAIRRSGAIAASFSEPSSHKGIQLKGTNAALIPTENSDAQRMATYLDLLASDVERVGNSGRLVRAALHCPIEEVAAIAFTPLEAFAQTPGALAGNRLGT
jgi:hypothetical protein